VSRGGAGKVRYRIALRSPVKIRSSRTGRKRKVVKTFALSGDRRRLDAEGELPVATGGWLLLRALERRR